MMENDRNTRALLDLAQEFQSATDRINETLQDLQQDIRELDRLRADIYKIIFFGSSTDQEQPRSNSMTK